MERKLATTQKISKLEPIEKADRIETASILGWKAVVQKEQYKGGKYMTTHQELCALYVRVVTELERNMQFIQEHKGAKSALDMDVMNTLIISNRVLLIERNDIGEILWHMGIDAQKLTSEGEK